jgi:hypothetical protein
MKPKLALLVLLITCTVGAKANITTNGEESAKKADIAGGVYHHDSKKPLGSVTVTVYSAAKKEKVVYTNGNGSYAFDDLKAGTYKFVFEKEGYKKVTRDKVFVRPDEGMLLNIEMSEHSTFELLPGPFHFTDLH